MQPPSKAFLIRREDRQIALYPKYAVKITLEVLVPQVVW